MLQHLLNKQMLAICVIIAVAVFFAILIDLICGLHKAKLRGEREIMEANENKALATLASLQD